MIKKLFLLLGTALVVIILVGLSVPGPVSSAAFTPQPAPPVPEDKGPETLKKAELIALGQIYGPEDIAVDARGNLYAGTQDGKLVRINPKGKLTTIAATGGRPLGLQFAADGRLIVCDAWKGLLSIDVHAPNPKATLRVLSMQADGEAFQFTNDLDIASDGMIYFTDASRFNQPDWMLDAYEAKAHGRLLRYDPSTQQTTVLMSGLYFANGVALSQNEDFLLVNETFRYRISRYWLKGPHKGQRDIFIDNLPGFPDGVAADRKGTFWVAMPTLRNPLLDKLHPMPSIKNLLAKLPDALSPQPQKYGLVLALNERGEIIKALHDSDGSNLSEITSVEPEQDYLLMGNLYGDRIGKLSLRAIRQ